MQLMASIFGFLFLAFLTVWIASNCARNTEFPSKNTRPILVGLVLLVISHGIQVSLLFSQKEWATGIAVIDALGLFWLTLGVTAWLPSVGIQEEKKELMNEMRAINENIASEEAGRIAFMKSFSFDLRSVLHSARFTVSGEEVVNSQVRKLVNDISFLIDEYLASRELGNSLIILNPTKYRIRDVMSEIESSFATGDSTNPPLRIVVEESVPEVVFGDVEKLRQIILSLYGFIKEMADGAANVQLSVQVAGLTAEEAMVRFLMRAADSQFKASAVKQITEVLSSYDKLYSQIDGIQGIRLQNASRLLQLFGGELGFSQDPLVGTGFSFTVPIEIYRGLTATLSKNDESPPADIFLGLRALIVDDNLIHREVLRRVLSDFGCHVTDAESAKAAMNVIYGEPIDIVFMDCEMPEIDGFAATKFLRKHEQQLPKRFPIIALTAHAFKDIQQKCRAAGMDGYVTKPANAREIAIAIEQQLEKYDIAIEQLSALSKEQESSDVGAAKD